MNLKTIIIGVVMLGVSYFFLLTPQGSMIITNPSPMNSNEIFGPIIPFLVLGFIGFWVTLIGFFKD